MAVSKANSNKQGDAGVLRAQDIVPPYNKKIHQRRDCQKMETNDVPAESADVEQKKDKIPKFDLAKEIMAEQRKITAIRRKAPAKTGPVRDPKDLGPEDKGSNGAGMIEAGLRQAQSNRVAGPGERTQAPSPEGEAESISFAVQPPPTLAEQEQIIAEIVARDIEQLCGHLDA
ncbi:MAG: hypothetical protein JSW47_22505 [Phycisphaerales bacterium]|nr:MAG: hypothetical protein JSW47_22505 [Phycisphaerales bacterium]